MRQDMSKVVVERPRRGGRGSTHRPRRVGDEWEGWPKQEGMRRAWKDRKELSDHLNPLYRYLDKQVGRPWNAVYSEMAKHLDRRSVLGFHVWSHVRQHVQLHVRILGGKPYAQQAFRGPVLVYGLYVDPNDGILKQHGTRFGWRQADGTPVGPYRSPFTRAVQAGHVKVISETTQLHRVHDGWYKVVLAPTPFGPYQDVLGVGPTSRHSSGAWEYPAQDMYGRKDVYAVSKRQISRKEQKYYGVS